MKRILHAAAAVLLFMMLISLSSFAAAKPSPGPSEAGALRVEGTQLLSQDGSPSAFQVSALTVCSGTLSMSAARLSGNSGSDGTSMWSALPSIQRNPGGALREQLKRTVSVRSCTEASVSLPRTISM